MTHDKEWYVDEGTGELVYFPDPFKGITPEQAQEAENAEFEIVGIKQQIERNFIRMSERLVDFEDRKLYLARGYSSMRLWASSPEIDMSWRVVQDLMRVQRELLPALADSIEDPTETLVHVGISKTRALLPLLRDEGGEEQVVDLLVNDDVAAMTWPDVNAEVKRRRGLEEPIDKRYPVMFSATVRKTDDNVRVDVTGSDGVAFHKVGVLTMPAAWWPRWESRFKDFVRYLDN